MILINETLEISDGQQNIFYDDFSKIEYALK
jgi:hypothetical protein